MGQLVEHVLLYMNHSHNLWPLYIDDPWVRVRHATRAMQAAGHDVSDEVLLSGLEVNWYGEFHGMVLVEDEAMGQLVTYRPRALVMLQGANDAARDTVAKYEERLRRYLGHLKARRALVFF